MQPPLDEFWLKQYPDSDQTEVLNIYRIALGDQMEAKERLTYRPPDNSHSPDFWNKSGSIGFMDVAVRNQSVPNPSAIPYPNPDNNPYLKYIYPNDQFETVKALVVLKMAIEPTYRGNICYVGTLIKRPEILARKWGLDTIVADHIENPGIKMLLPRLGYTLYDRGIMAVKRLADDSRLIF